MISIGRRFLRLSLHPPPPPLSLFPSFSPKKHFSLYHSISSPKLLLANSSSAFHAGRFFSTGSGPADAIKATVNAEIKASEEKKEIKPNEEKKESVPIKEAAANTAVKKENVASEVKKEEPKKRGRGKKEEPAVPGEKEKATEEVKPSSRSRKKKEEEKPTATQSVPLAATKATDVPPKVAESTPKATESAPKATETAAQEGNKEKVVATEGAAPAAESAAEKGKEKEKEKEKPKRTRKKKEDETKDKEKGLESKDKEPAEGAAAEGAAAEGEAKKEDKDKVEKPKRTRKKKEETPAAEGEQAATEGGEKPKKTRKKKEPAAEGEAKEGEAKAEGAEKKKKPKKKIGPVEKGNMMLAQSAWDQAIQHYTEAIENPTLITGETTVEDVLVRRSLVYQRLEKYEEAKKDLTNVLQTADKSKAIYADSLSKLAFVHVNEAKADPTEEAANMRKAIDLFAQAIDLKPDEKDMRYGRGMAYLRLEEYEKASADFSKTVEVDAGFAPGYFGRGEIALILRHFEKGAEDFSKFIEVHPTFYKEDPKIKDSTVDKARVLADGYFKRGVCYFTDHEYFRAKKDFTKVIDMNPAPDLLLQAFNFRGRCNYEDGDYWKCVDDNTKALKLDGNFSAAYADRGRAYEALGLNPESQDDFKQYTVRHREGKIKENKNPLNVDNIKV